MFNEIRAVKDAKFAPEEEKVILDSIKRNAFHAHPHNIILAMLGKSKFDLLDSTYLTSASSETCVMYLPLVMSALIVLIVIPIFLCAPNVRTWSQ